MRYVAYAFALAALAFAGRCAYRASVSDETRIRWLFEDAVEGFNATRLSPSVRPLAAGFVDETTGFTREDVEAVLVGAFFRAKDPETRAFLYRLEHDELTVERTEDEPDVARLTARLELFEGSDPERPPVWVWRLDAELAESDEGWRIEVSRWESEQGAMPRGRPVSNR